ncbi:serine/threonine-protein kinase RsbW [Sphaerisporangium krabiense]|uniref:Serine/threonine-protein kinase RsbW n=1 Tax=Sphaerisporangium krabiense TaxID=763782 RepID=A0A7W8Z3U7_9ACTN|nr:serine/threonine-protein kinase RsbW [Sphaerisporangium krabiense]
MLGDTLRCIGVSENCVSDVLLATSEACANAVRHGGPSKRYEVTAAIGQGRCELRVVDNGLGIGAVPRQYPAGDAEHGRGILIMQSVVDEIFFDITPGSGTTVLLRKELDWDEEFLARHDRELAAV